MYRELPFVSCLNNFSAVYNDVFIKENPSQMQTTYMLMQLSIMELTAIDSPSESLKDVFKFNFANGTSKRVDYAGSKLFSDQLLHICK